MRPRLEGACRLASLSAAALAAAPPAAADLEVSVQFAQFAPSTIDVLPGETVGWTNVSPRSHTVTAAAFDSGELAPGARFPWTAGRPARIRTTARSTRDDRRARRPPRHPGAAAARGLVAGTRVELIGRTADPLAPVRVERDRGGGFAQVAIAAASPSSRLARDRHRGRHGRLPRCLRERTSSQERRLLVSDRRLEVHAVRGGVAVSVTPSDPVRSRGPAAASAGALRLVDRGPQALRLPLAGPLRRAAPRAHARRPGRPRRLDAAGGQPRADPNRCPEGSAPLTNVPIRQAEARIAQGKPVARRGRKARGLAGCETARSPISNSIVRFGSCNTEVALR